MTRTTRNLIVGLMMTALACAARPACASDVDGEAIHHVRSSNASIVALISMASQQSRTFRALIETIDASDGIVYVEVGPCGRGVRACLVSVKSGGRHRFLRVHVRMGEADWDVMGSMGHELRHTIEVLSNPSVTDTAGLPYFYLHMASSGGFLKPFETEAAVAAGDAVRAEVQKYRRTNAPKPVMARERSVLESAAGSVYPPVER
jgi:hypothetical protein